MTTVYLVRHAEAEGNLYRRAQGHYDSTVTDRGYRQIAALARRFAGVKLDAVYASDLARTCTTALSVTLPQALPLHKDPALREFCLGVWEDRTWVELGYRERDALIAFNTDAERWIVEGGERIAAVRDRMLLALRRIIRENPDRTVAVFSHGMALRTLIGTLQGLTLRELNGTGHAENTAVCRLDCEDEQHIRVVYRDDSSHLPAAITTLAQQEWHRNRDTIERGIYYAPAEEDGAFRVCFEEQTVGSVRVCCGGGIGEITEYTLIPDFRAHGYGICLLGQALSYARSRGCDTLRCILPRSDEKKLARALRYGFTQTSQDGAYAVLDKYYGFDEAYRVERLRKELKI